MKIAYADPPYLGCGARYYNAPEWDRIESHQQLIVRLCSEFPDGWALSLHTPSLQIILPMCPSDVRIAAWVKPYSGGAYPNVNPIYAWEPVIYRGGRKGRDNNSTVDWIAQSCPRSNNFIGQKPRKFCLWLFTLLGLQAEDHFVDLFLGSGAVTVAWDEFCKQERAQLKLAI
jgi:hypothetical protein